eukprot:COSAG03_NODE_17974_length_364_cov_0.950943_1_plen_96_part_01
MAPISSSELPQHTGTLRDIQHKGRFEYNSITYHDVIEDVSSGARDPRVITAVQQNAIASLLQHMLQRVGVQQPVSVSVDNVEAPLLTSKDGDVVTV